jgi:putative methyltransferase (TIGR04325 family)
MSKKNLHIWEGIYDRFPIDDSGGIFESERWLKSLPTFSQEERRETLSPHSLIHEYPLAPFVAILIVSSDDPVEVLDFGGGLGNSFFPLIASLPAPGLVEFHVVETPMVCRHGRELYEEYQNLHFHETLPGDTERFDIVHAAAALHYVADWRIMLERFAAYEPRFIMLFGLTAGDIKTFATYQNYYGSKVPVWFWNVNEIIDTMKDLGYELTYKSLLAASYLGEVQPLPMGNFPAEYRLERKCNLMFTHNDHTKL